MGLRLKNFDYGKTGIYFITIVTKNRQHFFGHIEKEIMIMNDMGRIAYKQWYRIPEQFPYIELDRMIIMPNHIHGIIWIDKGLLKYYNEENFKTTNSPGGITGNKNPMLYHNLGRVIRWFKAITTYYIHRQFPNENFAWQSRYHDIIIRNKEQLENIRKYIITNPENWDEDELM